MIIVNYHGAFDTIKCIRSLFLAVPTPRVVVVDNTPDDRELEKALMDYPEIHLIRARENLGFGKGNNLGIDWALTNTTCDFIFLLNNDATIRPDTINFLEEAMESCPEAGIIAPRIVLADDPDRLWYGGGDVDWRRGGAKIPGIMGAADAPLAMTRRFVGFASGCAMYIRRQSLVTAKGFDPRFFMYDEDLELSLRVTELGWKILYFPHALVSHAGQGSLRKGDHPFIGKWNVKNSNFAFYAYHMTKNSVINAMTHARGLDAIIYAIWYPMFIFKKLIPHLAKLRFSAVAPVAKGIWDGLCEGRRGRVL